jgi:plastocyanin
MRRAAWAAAWVGLCVVVGHATDKPAVAPFNTHTIMIENVKFNPETLIVRRGDHIVWVNKDLFPHTATAGNRSFDSGPIAAGASWSYVVKAAGQVDYVCTLHPTMKGHVSIR